MRVEIANLVFPVIRRALQSLERLDAGQALPCEAEQAAFKALLLTEREAQIMVDFGADLAVTPSRFLGIRYALTCWLDDTLGTHSAWQHAWRENTLAAALCRTHHGATSFWEQAELALARPAVDACEAFYLCAHLGFQGGRRETPDALVAWVQKARTRLAGDLAAPWPTPPALELEPQAPPLRQRDKLHRTLIAVSVPLTVLTPLAAWLLARRLGF